MSNLFRTAAIVMSLSVAGCAIHPLPDDVTGIPTYIIARKIRCEARAALRDNLADWLKKIRDDPVANRFGLEFENGTRPLNTFHKAPLRDWVKAVIQNFENSAIAYNFTFDMTETNNLDATLDLIWPLRRKTGSAAIGAGVDRTRQNTRTFTIADKFIGLLAIPDDYCNMFTYGSNYLYPITGTIGVAEMIHTFLELTLFDNLSAADPTKPGPPTMGDTIAFTTKLSGSATPKIVLTPVGSALQVADASLVGAATRNDVHKVLVGLALPTTGATALNAKQMAVGFLVTAGGSGLGAEALAAHTIEQMIIRFELARPGVVVIPSP